MSIFDESVLPEAPTFTVPDSLTVKDRDDNDVTVNANSKAFPIAEALLVKQRELNDLDEANAAIKAQRKILEDKREAMRLELDAISKQIYDIDEGMFDYRRKHRALTNEILQLRTQLSQALQSELAEKKMLENALEFSKRISTYHYSDRIMEHQKEGAYFLATSMRAILGDKMGAGKTLTSIAAWDMAQSQRILVVVPDDVVSNFVNEIHYWAPHRNVMQIGRLPKAVRSVAIQTAKNLQQFVMVINYSAWRRDLNLLDELIALRFDTIVMDEAHSIKNVSTSAYKGVKRLVLAENCCPLCSGEVVNKATADNWSNYDECITCGWQSNDRSVKTEWLDRCSVKMVVPMSGTVILNKPQDLFALLSLVDPVNFRQERDFLVSYCQQDFYTGKWQFRSGGLASLQKKLSGKYIARAGVKTPGQTVYNHDIILDAELYPKQHKVIEQLSKHAQIMLDNGEKMSILHIIALITRKRQANVWPAGITLKNEKGEVVFNVGDDVTESVKLDKCIMHDREVDELTGLIPELTENGDKELGSRVVVFSQFKGPLAELERRLKAAGISVVRFDGDTPQRIRDEAKIDFDRKFCEQPEYVAQYDGGYKWQVILCNYKTGGVGLNFTAATETIILDREWNPGKENQAFGRTDRIGQTEHSNVHVIRLENTIDVWLDNLISEKEDLINGFNEAAEPLSKRLFDAMKNGDML